jgi:hypothetical protein
MVDSGSSHSFVNSSLSSSLVGISSIATPCRVEVANGQVIQCAIEMKQANWSIQEVAFVAGLTLLPLPYYDMILGIDWLEKYNPMKVDWRSKWMMINYKGSSVQLHGLQPSLPEYSLVEVMRIQEVHVEPMTDQLPESIQRLLTSFAELFEEPVDLPPDRSCNHSIPLIPRAQQVNIRPYRFSPTLKNEIEAQVQKMLSKGIIQHSQSVFSSLVLLVKKKDKTW